MRGREVGVTHGAARLARDIRHAIVRDDPARQARRPYSLGVPPDPRAELCDTSHWDLSGSAVQHAVVPVEEAREAARQRGVEHVRAVVALLLRVRHVRVRQEPRARGERELAVARGVPGLELDRLLEQLLLRALRLALGARAVRCCQQDGEPRARHMLPTRTNAPRQVCADMNSLLAPLRAARTVHL
eukprot:scaffold18973_cov66-Phaeocystis_antarctica.AAC.3